MDPMRHPEALLGPYRVLDLTDEQGLLAGKLLGDLGADVIKVEPPGGDPARRLGPFYHDQPHPERSLPWLAFNLNKRSITLNLACVDGQALFRRLVQSADFVLESFAPGYLEGLGLGYERLRALNPRLIVAAISPFGQSGPYRDYRATDLVATALGGFMYVTGDADRAPVRISFPVSYCHAGAEAAAACVMAHYYRERTGQGQFIDVSIQECVVWTLMNTTVTWDLLRSEVMRGAGVRVNPQTGVRTQQIWPCKDGYVSFILRGGLAGAHSTRSLVAWMDEEGRASPWLAAIQWMEVDVPHITQELYDALAAEIGAFFQTKGMSELYERAVRDRILLAPILTAKEVLESPQLRAREYFVEVEHPELGAGVRLVYPDGFVKLSAWAPRRWRRAPLIGEHNEEVYCGELGLARDDLPALAQAGVI
ncbi:MAG: CoA transferase [Chloroflexi bacterium]|nr:CoA transferase [Chloroflexota bacterium]